MEEAISLYPDDPSAAERVRILDSLLATPTDSRSALSIYVRPNKFALMATRHLHTFASEYALGLEKWDDEDNGYFLCMQPVNAKNQATASKIYLELSLAGVVNEFISVIGTEKTDILAAKDGHLESERLYDALFDDLSHLPRPLRMVPLDLKEQGHYFISSFRR